jgi:hypothetical protein
VLQKNSTNYFFSNSNKNVISKGFETNVKFIYKEDFKLFIGYTFTNAKANYLQGNLANAFATVALGTDAYAANRLNGSAGANVLRFVQGTVTGTATAGFSGTNKPAGNSSNVWMQITIDGTTLYIPVWT